MEPTRETPPGRADGDPAAGEDAQALHGSRARTGLTPLIWCSVTILIVLAVLAWELR